MPHQARLDISGALRPIIVKEILDKTSRYAPTKKAANKLFQPIAQTAGSG